MGKMTDRITSLQARSREPRQELAGKQTGAAHAPVLYEPIWIYTLLPGKSMRITIMSRPECHLCHVVARVAAWVQEEFAFQLTIIDIDRDEQLRQQYGDRIPVVLLDDREILSGKVTGGQLRKAIKKARWRDPISRILSRVKLALTRG